MGLVHRSRGKIVESDESGWVCEIVHGRCMSCEGGEEGDWV